MWKDRQTRIRAEGRPLISSDAKVATIGSCFAEEIAHSLGRMGLAGSMHPGGLFYTTASIRQEVERIFGQWPGYGIEPRWKVPEGWVHPFKEYSRAFPSPEALEEWSTEIDRRAEVLFKTATVIVFTLGLVEAWRNPTTGNFYRQIPHPAMFRDLRPVFHRLTVGEMLEDLGTIRKILRERTAAEIVITVSPVPLHATVTPLDVRMANTESKSRIRAAVSEFVEAHPDVHYFHSYEIVTTAERASDFMREDGRHVERRAVDYIVGEFLRQFAAPDVAVPDPGVSWLTPAAKTAPTVHAPLRARLRAALRRPLGALRMRKRP